MHRTKAGNALISFAAKASAALPRLLSEAACILNMPGFSTP